MRVINIKSIFTTYLEIYIADMSMPKLQIHAWTLISPMDLIWTQHSMTALTYIFKLCKYKEAINQVGYINKIMKCEVHMIKII